MFDGKKCKVCKKNYIYIYNETTCSYNISPACVCEKSNYVLLMLLRFFEFIFNKLYDFIFGMWLGLPNLIWILLCTLILLLLQASINGNISSINNTINLTNITNLTSTNTINESTYINETNVVNNADFESVNVSDNYTFNLMELSSFMLFIILVTPLAVALGILIKMIMMD